MDVFLPWLVKTTGQIKVKVQIKVSTIFKTASKINERWTTVYLLMLKLKQEGLCLTQLTCCLDKVTVGHLLFVHALCFCSYQLNSPSALESLYQRTLAVWSLLLRSVSRQQNKQTKEKPLEIQTLNVSGTLFFLPWEALSKQKCCSIL